MLYAVSLSLSLSPSLSLSLSLSLCEQVVVTRWYGGVHLGPDRFKDINNTGRALLVSEGYVTSKGEKSPKKKGKKKQ